jgi:hypothetical protein
MNTFFSKLIAAAAAAVMTSVAWADPPGRVGRLGVHGGTVMMAPAGGEWRAIAHNYPVTNGDNVYVGPDGRAEIDFGSGSAWLAGGTTVYFDRIDDHHVRIRLSDGQMVIRIRELDRGETARVDMRRGGVDITAPGLYRFETNSNFTRSGGDVVHVKYGNAELSTGSSFEPLRSGDAAEFDGARIGFLNIRGEDAFGSWADSRDRRYENQRYAYVSPYMVGARDLDEHGYWRENGSYGWVWFPRRVANDWAPYRFGHWTHVAPWGWTWVDDSPWGFAPFHYGRWVHLNGRWGWTPGPWERRPVYSPALVAWHGQLGNASINVNFGSNSLVYWTPLAWGEAYYPSYAVSANFWRVINRPYVPQHYTTHYHVRPPQNYEYRNWRAPGGATVVEAGVIANARPVATSMRAMGPLPTTQQVEAMSVYDRVKPLYEGAPSRVSNAPVQAAPRAAPVSEAAVVRAMPPANANVPQPTIPSYTAPGRAQPQVNAIPTQPAPQTSMPAMREQAVIQQAAPAPQPIPSRAAPQQVLPSQPAPMPQTSMPAIREQATVQTQAAPAPMQPQPNVQDTRRVVPTQNRGEAMPSRPVQPFVEPVIRAPRAVAPQAVGPAPVQGQPQQALPSQPQERSRRGGDDRDKDKRQ